MRNPAWLLSMACVVPLIVCGGGCGRNISDEELGHVITDLSLVPGTADPYELPDLIRGLHDHEPLVRGACAWALGRYQRVDARTALAERLAAENDQGVRDELARAMRDE